MSRINTNIPSLVAQRVLHAQSNALNQSLMRLSTGYRINSGKDDPAGLIAAENLEAEKSAINAAITNVSRADNVVSVAEGGLTEVSNLLTQLEDLVSRSANDGAISDDERQANQLQIDSILESINRISTGTEFQGRKLLSGELSYTTSGVVGNSNLANVAINAAKVPNGGSQNVTVEVTTAAELASLTYSGGTLASGSVTLEVAGNLGAQSLTFASGATISNIADGINASKYLTGVSATTSGTTLIINSTSYGSKNFVSVKAIDGTFTVTGGTDGKDYGVDAGVRINGTAAVADGLHVSARNASLNVDIDLEAAFGTTTGSTSFAVTGGGANFMILPTISLAGTESLGINSVSTSSLGNATVGFVSSLGTGEANALSTSNYSTAQQIIRAAENAVSELRGRLGAFQKDTLETTANSLQVTLENTSAAEASIRETDFASETSNLTRAQILVQAATNTLKLANAVPQTALQLLQ